MISPEETDILRKMSTNIFLDPRQITPLAFRLGESASQDDIRWVRFAGHAAILLELDDNSLVEDMPLLPEEKPATFGEYKTNARQRYNATLDDKLQAWNEDAKWQPVREAMSHLYMLEHHVVLDEHDDTTEELFRRHYASQTDQMVDHVQAVNDLLLSQGYLSTPEDILKEAGNPKRLMKMAGINLAASNLLVMDLGEGDPHNASWYDAHRPAGDRLNLAEDVNDIKVGKESKTVGQLDRQSEVIPLPCAALLNSGLIYALLDRVADEAYECGLLGHTEKPRSPKN